MASDYLGKVVFVERAQPTKDYSAYYDGEYIVVRQTPNNLYGVPTGGGMFGMFDNERALPLTGAQRYTVISADDAPETVRQIAEQARQFAAKVNEPNRQWQEHVYHRAAKTADTLEKLLKPKVPGWTLNPALTPAFSSGEITTAGLINSLLKRASGSVTVNYRSTGTANVTINIDVSREDIKGLL